MDVITIEAAPREVGKKGSRAVRRAGNVPCVLYGHHVEPVALQVPELSLRPLVYTSETHRVELSSDGESWECIMKDIDFHPVTDRPIHADFLVLQAGERLTLTVPVQYHGIPVGQTDGGDTQYSLHELEVTCLPKDIPSHIDVDVSQLQIGDSLHISDLTIEGVTLEGRPEQTLVSVLPPRLLEVEEEEDEGLEGLLGEGAVADEAAEDESEEEL